MSAPNLNDHERRLAILEDHAADTLQAMNTLADATQHGFDNLNAKVDQALVLLQSLTGIADKGFKTAFHQTTEMRAEIRTEFAALNAKVDQVLAALTGRPRP